MSRPTETPCVLPTTVGCAAANEEQSPSPEVTHHIEPIAIDGEGGIPYTRKMVAHRDRAKAGEGKSLPSVSLFPRC